MAAALADGGIMRRIAWLLLLLFAFAIPWEYSLELGEPLGNIARVVGLLLLLVAIPALLQAGRLRAPGAMQGLVLAFYLWLCCTYFWTIEPLATQATMRAGFQEMMIVWLVWEFAESAGDLRALLRAYVAGSWVLALLTVASFASADAIATGQIRFAASGQDPNDLAHFLDLGFPLAALLLNSEPRWPWRLLAAGYLPLGLVAVLLTASRGGFLAAVVALAGSGLLLAYGHPRRVLAGTLALPPIAVLLWFTVPHGTFERLSTISEQLRGGDLNQRLNIWKAGWHAFVQAPFFGTGAGSLSRRLAWRPSIRPTTRLFPSLLVAVCARCFWPRPSWPRQFGRSPKPVGRSNGRWPRRSWSGSSPLWWPPSRRAAPPGCCWP
jgi:O-antigen ligase